MDLWGSDAQVGDEVYHIHFGKVRIEELDPNCGSGLAFKLRISSWHIRWDWAENLSWIPFPVFDRGKKRVKVKKWKWAFKIFDPERVGLSERWTEKEALEIYGSNCVKLPWTEVEE